MISIEILYHNTILDERVIDIQCLNFHRVKSKYLKYNSKLKN